MVAIAPGFHLFPFRTEKLSPSTPMVLPNGGRVGSRRPIRTAWKDEMIFSSGFRFCRALDRRFGSLDILEALDALQQFFSVTSDFVNQAFVIFRALLVAKPSPLIEVFHYIIYMHEEQTEAAV